MTLTSDKFGVCDVVLDIGYSSVDTYIEEAYSDKLGRKLTNEELDELQAEFEPEIQMYSYSEGGSRNHN